MKLNQRYNSINWWNVNCLPELG